MTDQGLTNLQWAHALLDGLASAGVRDLVLSPGSRSTPLTLAASLHSGLATTVVVDERCAAFLALGMAKASARPVALVATSGSAPGNWLPAVMEADAAAVPLVLLSADRPWELQQCGANQTTDQLKLFGSHVRSFHQLSEAVPEPALWRRLQALGRQLVHEARWPRPGPVHLNAPFREPLVPEHTVSERPATPVTEQPLPRLQPDPSQVGSLQQAMASGFGLILCGEGVRHPEAVMELAAAAGAPLLADTLSGVRFCGRRPPEVIEDYAHLMQQIEGDELRPDWILQFGRPPLSASLQAVLRRWQVVPHWTVDAHGRWLDPLGLGVQPVAADEVLLCEALRQALPTREEPNWLYRWRHAQIPRRGTPAEGILVRQLLQVLEENSLLFCGNSLPVRWVDAWAGNDERRISFFANRGVSGIDGNLSTFIGMARRWPGEGRKIALVGDLTFQHDLGALATVGDLDATVVVIDNGGGGIFDQLPQRKLPGFLRYWRTPQALDLGALDELFGIGFQRVEAVEELGGALTKAHRRGGFQVVEVVLGGQ